MYETCDSGLTIKHVDADMTHLLLLHHQSIKQQRINTK